MSKCHIVGNHMSWLIFITIKHKHIYAIITNGSETSNVFLNFLASRRRNPERPKIQVFENFTGESYATAVKVLKFLTLFSFCSQIKY